MEYQSPMICLLLQYLSCSDVSVIGQGFEQYFEPSAEYTYYSSKGGDWDCQNSVFGEGICYISPLFCRIYIVDSIGSKILPWIHLFIWCMIWHIAEPLFPCNSHLLRICRWDWRRFEVMQNSNRNDHHLVLSLIISLISGLCISSYCELFNSRRKSHENSWIYCLGHCCFDYISLQPVVVIIRRTRNIFVLNSSSSCSRWTSMSTWLIHASAFLPSRKPYW